MPNYISKIRIPDATAQAGYVEYDIKDEVARQQLLTKLEKKKVDVLPPKPGTQGVTYDSEQIAEMLRTIYLVLDADAAVISQNVYVEWVLVNNGTTENPVYEWEKLGTTETDLEGYSLKGHTHQVTPRTAVADHSFTVSGNTPVPDFVGESTSFSASGNVSSGSVNIAIEGSNGTGTSYTPEVSVGGKTEQDGSHSHTFNKSRKYLKKGAVRGVHDENKKASKVSSTTQYTKVAQVADSQTSIQKYNVTDGSVTITPTTAYRATGDLENVASGNEGNAVFHSATVDNNGVLSFELKQLAKGSTLTGASATTTAKNVTSNGTEKFYAAKDGSGVTINHHVLDTDVDVPVMDSDDTTVATGELTTNSAQGVSRVVEDIGGNQGDNVTTSSEGAHRHNLETKAEGVTTTGTTKKFSGSIADGSVSVSGTLTPLGHNAFEDANAGRFTSDQVTLSHSVFNPTVITGPDDTDINHVTDWYGITYNEVTDSNPANNTRIGNMTYHKTLPIHSAMRRCLLLDNGEVNYYLDPNDSTKKMDGTAADLSGADGQVMVEVPRHWRFVSRDESTNDIVAMISPYEQQGWVEVPKYYISAYEATVDRTIDTSSGRKLASVVNTTSAFRGGENNESWDNTDKSLLGRPATNISHANFRTYARNRGASGSYRWNMMTYDIYIDLYWLYVIEYANRNSQATFNASLTSEGYKQGGLGSGVTILDQTLYNSWNSSNPFVPCGITNSLGNETGFVSMQMPDGYGSSVTVNVPSYRGIENPFGHIFKIVDGIKLNNNHVYRTSDPSKFSSAQSQGSYVDKGLECDTNGYISEIMIGTDGDITPLDTDGGSTQYYCDSYMQANASYEGGWNNKLTYACAVGGHAYMGSGGGLACYNSYMNINNTTLKTYGTRLCFF